MSQLDLYQVFSDLGTIHTITLCTILSITLSVSLSNKSAPFIGRSLFHKSTLQKIKAPLKKRLRWMEKRQRETGRETDRQRQRGGDRDREGGKDRDGE